MLTSKVSGMLLKEVMQKSGLTRKQIEILQQKGLIHPAREENGYRNYTEQDLKTLKQVNFLKKFEFTLDECHALLIQGDTAVLDQKREQLLSQRYRLDTALQYLDHLKNPDTQQIDLESVEQTFDLYDQISAGQRGQKIIQMEKEIARAQVPFPRLIDMVTGIGFFLTAMMPQLHQRLIVLAAAQLFVQEIKMSTRFRWLILRIGQFLRVI